VQRSTIGVGPALRKARLTRGATVAEASRDTKIRQEFIKALEDEDFDRLLGDVYVRGALRSYATYLGLPADRVLARYAATAGEAVPTAPGPPSAGDPVVGAPRRRDNHLLIAMITAVLVVLAVAFGVLSPRESAPTPASTLGTQPLAEAQGPGISLSVSTQTEPVDVRVAVDSGEPVAFRLLPGESRSFDADVSVAIRVSPGATADIVVNGVDKGTPGRSSRAWTHTYGYGTDAASRANG
jgi:hypothetical protein